MTTALPVIRFGTLEALIAELAAAATVRMQTLTTSQADRLGISREIVRLHITAPVNGSIGVWTYRTGLIEEINGTPVGRYDRATVATVHSRVKTDVAQLLTDRGHPVKLDSMYHVPAEVLNVEGATALFDLRSYYAP